MGFPFWEPGPHLRQDALPHRLFGVLPFCSRFPSLRLPSFFLGLNRRTCHCRLYASCAVFVCLAAQLLITKAETGHWHGFICLFGLLTVTRGWDMTASVWLDTGVSHKVGFLHRFTTLPLQILILYLSLICTTKKMYFNSHHSSLLKPQVPKWSNDMSPSLLFWIPGSLQLFDRCQLAFLTFCPSTRGSSACSLSLSFLFQHGQGWDMTWFVWLDMMRNWVFGTIFKLKLCTPLPASGNPGLFQRGVGIVTGIPRVFFGNAHPYLRKRAPTATGAGFYRYEYGFSCML